MDILIRNISFAPLDTSENRIVENGIIAVAGNRIMFAGGAGDVPAEIMNQEIGTLIDGQGMFAIPALANSHTHSPMTLLRGYKDDVPLEKWLFDYMFPAEDKLTRDFAFWGAKLAIAEMLKSGVSCFADQYFFMDAVADAVVETGVRANLCRGLQCFDEHFDAAQDRRLLENRELFMQYNNAGDGRIKVSVGPHSVYTCTTSYLEACSDLAAALGTSIQIHVSETSSEVKNCYAMYGHSPVMQCLKTGLFEHDTIAAHCVHLDQEDIRILKEKNVKVAHNPGSNLKLGSGMADINLLIENGISVCLGTDGAASNNNLDMFEEMNLAALIPKGKYQRADIMDAWTVLRMATTNGQAACGFPDAGTISGGALADICMVDMNKAHLVPCFDPVSHLVYSAHSSDVDTLLIDGKIQLRQSKLINIDEQEIMQQCDRIAKIITA